MLISAVDFAPPSAGAAAAALRLAVGEDRDAVGLDSPACDLPMGDEVTLKLNALPPPPAVGEPAAMGENESDAPAAVGVFNVCCG